MKKLALSLAAAAVAAVAFAALASAGSAPGHATLVIRHQVRGCHTWSVNGGPFAASQNIVIRRGGWITITNNDVMPHQLVKTSGPSIVVVNLKTGMMGMGVRSHPGPGMM